MIVELISHPTPKVYLDLLSLLTTKHRIVNKDTKLVGKLESMLLIHISVPPLHKRLIPSRKPSYISLHHPCHTGLALKAYPVANLEK